MRYLEIVQKDFMGEQTHKVTDITTARNFLYAMYKGSQHASNHMGLRYRPLRQYVLVKDTHSDDVQDWRGRDGKDFENSTDDLQVVYLAFTEKAVPRILELLKLFQLEPEMREICLATIAQPQAMFGLMIAYDHNARETLSHGLKPLSDFYDDTSRSYAPSKNMTDHDDDSVRRVIESVCIKVRWPSNVTIYNRNLKEVAKEQK